MFRYTDDWQNSQSKYEGNLSENFSTDDLSIKGSFRFYKDSLTFTGIRTFSKEPNPISNKSELLTASNYTLDIKPSPLTTTQITHLHTGELTIESEFNIWQSENKDHSVGVYKKTEVDVLKNINSSVQVLYNYGRNYLFNFGLKNYPFTWVESSLAPTFSVGTIARIKEDKDLNSWGGVHLNFNVKNITDLKFLLGVANPTINGVLEVGLKRKLTTPEIVITNVKSATPTFVTYPKLIKLGLEGKVTDKFSFFTTFDSEIDEKDTKTNTTFGGLYTFDPVTNMKFRIKDDLNTTLSLTKRFRNLIDFTFTTDLSYKPAGDKKNLMASIKSKFGVGINFIDETMI